MIRDLVCSICSVAMIPCVALGVLIPAQQSYGLAHAESTEDVIRLFVFSRQEPPSDLLYFAAVNDDSLELALERLPDVPSPQRFQRLWARTRLQLRLYAATNDPGWLYEARQTVLVGMESNRPEFKDVWRQLQ